MLDNDQQDEGTPESTATPQPDKPDSGVESGTGEQSEAAAPRRRRRAASRPAAVLAAVPEERWAELDLSADRTIEERLRRALGGGVEG